MRSSSRRRGAYTTVVAFTAMLLAFACTQEITSTDPTLENPDEVVVIRVEPSSVTIQVGETVQLTAVARGKSNNAVSGGSVLWSSTDSAVATVSGSGLVTGMSEGSVTITAAGKGQNKQDEGATASILVEESQLEPTRVRISPASVSLDPGATQQFSARIENQLGSEMSGSIEWSATGGSISAAGLYTAGDVPGSYWVTAREPSRGIADTADVSIAGASGALQINTSTSGSSLDPNGYTVIIDGIGSRPIGINDQLTIPELPVGDHSVRLSDIASNCTVSGANPRTVTIVAGSTASTSFSVSCADAGPGGSISDITFDWSTYQLLAQGSDNWPMTWCEDGHQYTSWGDGGGFGGTNQDGRVSLGFARIEGDYPNFTGINVWGGVNAENPAQFGGKSRSIVCINGSLYAWRSEGSNTGSFRWKQIIRSTDKAASWEENVFPSSRLEGCVGCPGLPFFINYGQNYSANTDGYIYIYTIRIADPDLWDIQRPGVIWLARAPVGAEAFADTANWEWLTSAAPTWGARSDRAPVLEDADGFMKSSALYVPGLDRYVMVTNHTTLNDGNIAFWEAPNPWGPWRLIWKKMGWPGGETGVVPPSFGYGGFSPKWLSADGRDCVFIWFRPDAWNSVACKFVTAP